MAVISKPITRAVLAVTVAVLAFGAAIALSLHSEKKPTAAWANMTISINPGNVPTTAQGFNTHTCDPNQGGGPFPDQDVWVFVLPGNPETSGEFVSITATFLDENNMIQVKSINTTDDPDQFNSGDPGTSKGWIFTPDGWTLTGATADITGTAESFNLTHTCPASGSPTPSPSMSRSPSASPSMSKSPSASPSMSRTPSPTPSMSKTPSPTPSRTHSPRPSPSKSGYSPYHHEPRMDDTGTWWLGWWNYLLYA